MSAQISPPSPYASPSCQGLRNNAQLIQAPRHHGRQRRVPLAIRLTAGNVHDSRVFEDLIDAVPTVRQRRGRPRQRPTKLHADKAYDVPRCREVLRRRRIMTRIARRGADSRERLGRHRWVVESTLAWFGRFRPLSVRYERRADIHEALLSLAASFICWRYVQRWFC